MVEQIMDALSKNEMSVKIVLRICKQLMCRHCGDRGFIPDLRRMGRGAHGVAFLLVAECDETLVSWQAQFEHQEPRHEFSWICSRSTFFGEKIILRFFGENSHCVFPFVVSLLIC